MEVTEAPKNIVEALSGGKRWDWARPQGRRRLIAGLLIVAWAVSVAGLLGVGEVTDSLRTVTLVMVGLLLIGKYVLAEVNQSITSIPDSLLDERQSHLVLKGRSTAYDLISFVLLPVLLIALVLGVDISGWSDALFALLPSAMLIYGLPDICIAWTAPNPPSEEPDDE